MDNIQLYSIHVQCTSCEDILLKSEPIPKEELKESIATVRRLAPINLDPCKKPECRGAYPDLNTSYKVLVYDLNLNSYVEPK